MQFSLLRIENFRSILEAEILEAVQIVAIFNATNRLNAGLGIKVDDGAHDALRRS